MNRSPRILARGNPRRADEVAVVDAGGARSVRILARIRFLRLIAAARGKRARDRLSQRPIVRGLAQDYDRANAMDAHRRIQDKATVARALDPDAANDRPS